MMRQKERIDKNSFACRLVYSKSILKVSSEKCLFPLKYERKWIIIKLLGINDVIMIL